MRAKFDRAVDTVVEQELAEKIYQELEPFLKHIPYTVEDEDVHFVIAENAKKYTDAINRLTDKGFLGLTPIAFEQEYAIFDIRREIPGEDYEDLLLKTEVGHSIHFLINIR